MKGELVRLADKQSVGKVDREKHIISGVSVITMNREALGHDLYIDEETGTAVLALGKAKEPLGLKSRFDHPNACSRSMGSFIGYFHNLRRDGDNIRADLSLDESASKAPDGDLRDYIETLATSAPDAFATSIVARFEDNVVFQYGDDVPADDPRRLPHARATALSHCDVVDAGAANDGIFGRPNYFQEQALFWAQENLPTIFSIIDKAQKWGKTQDGKQGGTDMELQARIDELTAELATVKVERDTLKTSAEAHATALTEATATGVSEGEANIQTRLSSRLTEYDNDVEFAVKTIELDDGATKDERIKSLQADLDDKNSGAPPVGSGGPAGGDLTGKQEWDAKVKEIQDERKLSKADATKACVKEFPKLHEDKFRK